VTMTEQDAVLISLLAYAGLRPEEALALVWGDITARHIRVERAVALGEIREDDVVKRHDRSVRLLQPLAEDLRAWKPARGAIPLRNQLLFSRRDGGRLAGPRLAQLAQARLQARGEGRRPDAHAPLRSARVLCLAAHPGGEKRRRCRQAARPYPRDVPALLRAAFR
jgi:integrase